MAGQLKGGLLVQSLRSAWPGLLPAASRSYFAWAYSPFSSYCSFSRFFVSRKDKSYTDFYLDTRTGRKRHSLSRCSATSCFKFSRECSLSSNLKWLRGTWLFDVTKRYPAV